MKKFIAFNGGSNSGIVTAEKAISWATDQLSKQSTLSKVYITEVIEVVERTAPAIKINRFCCEPEEQAKAA